MEHERESLADVYDRNYVNANYFGYRKWLYRPYIRALARRANLVRGSSVLDAGCGQGFFTWLFSELGCAALGVDISPEGISAANRQYGSSGARYLVGDVRNLGFAAQFDCVFTRSCSLYNKEGFGTSADLTDRFLEYVKPGGVFIFDYYTRLSSRRKSASWTYHSLRDLKRHFSRYTKVETFFSLRIDSILVGSSAFSKPASWINTKVSKWTGVGGELVAIVYKQ